MTVYTPKYPQQSNVAYHALDMVQGPVLIYGANGLEFANESAHRFFDFASLPPNPGVKEVIANGHFDLPDLVARQLEKEDQSSGLHVAHRDGTPTCFRLLKKPLMSGHTILTFEAVQTERDNQQLRLLLRIAEMGAKRTSVEAVCEEIVAEIFTALKVDIAVLALLDRGSLKPVAWRGLMLEPEFGTTGIVTEEVERALETNKPVTTGGAEWGSGLGDLLTGTHFVVPLVFGGQTIGTLHLGALSSVRLFTFSSGDDGMDPASSLDDMDRSFLETLSDQIALTLDGLASHENFEASRTQLRAVVDAIPEGVIVFDSDGKILVANPESKRICETEWTNLNARRPYRVCAIDGRPLPRPEWPFFRAVSSKSDIFGEELIFDFGEHERNVLVDVVRVDQTTLVGTIRDISDQKASEQRYEDFLSAIGHELRSPLTPLSGLLQIIRARVEKGGEIEADHVANAQKQVGRISRLIDAMLDVTRIETGRIVLRKQRIDLNRVIKSLAETWRIQFPDHPIRIVVPEATTMVDVDPERIEQVLGNLVENAAKNSDAEQPIGVTLVSSPVSVTISDQGVGMDEETLSHVFERFFQGKPNPDNRGVGLGLYITREIVEQHGGTIDIVSSLGEGTAVTITIPH